MESKKTTFEPFVEKKEGFTRIGVHIINPSEALIRIAEDDAIMRKNMNRDINRLMFGGA